MSFEIIDIREWMEADVCELKSEEARRTGRP